MSRSIEAWETLKGIKVVDLTHAWAGPSCTMLLGDMGAEVIKVESLTGDTFRVAGEGSMFVNINRNKRGISLNLKKREGLEIILKLLRKADVFVENYLPGAMDRLGLGYEAISHLNPGIIYCSISGYGQTGPFRENPAYDPITQAMSGIMVCTGEPDGPPVRVLPAMIDSGAGKNGAFAIVLSLMDRQKTGKGQRIDIAMLDVALTEMSLYITKYSMTGELPERMGSGHTNWAPYEAFPARDGMVLICVTTEQMWKNLCKALELKDLDSDTRYSTRDGRRQNRKELVAALKKVTQQYGSQELESKLLAMDVPCARLRSVADIIQEPHVQVRQILEHVDYPTMGKIITVRNPIFLSGQSAPTRLQAPMLGEHTNEVLRELGYSDKEIDDFIEKGVALQYNS